MKTFLLLVAAALAASAAEPFKLIHVADLEKALASKTPPIVYDANGKTTRERAGVVPGAKLLSSGKFDPAKELPADKARPLVFYCANEMCMASHEAAEKAVKAGHTDVSVMSDGIFGWKKAGKPVQRLAGAPAKLEPKAVDALVKKGDAVVVDVREDEERHEVVPGALWMPMSKAKDEKAWSAFVASLPKGKTTVFHCAMGGRAKKAAEKLFGQGYDAAFFESPDQWKAAGLPVEQGPAR